MREIDQGEVTAVVGDVLIAGAAAAVGAISVAEIAAASSVVAIRATRPPARLMVAVMT